MKTRLLTFVLILSWISIYADNKPDNDVYELISSRIREENLAETNLQKVEKAVADGIKFYNQDGSFSDVDYDARNRTDWPPLNHIDRLSDFTFAYTMPGNIYYKDQNIYEIIEKSLSYWYDRNPECSNWWYNQIAEPQRIGVILLQMQTGEKQLPPELVAKTLERMRTDGGNPMKQTGPNKTDIALHWLYRACLTKNAGLLKQTMEQAFEPIRYTTGEGMQYDNCYFQHGRQLYIIGYGDELLKGVTKFAMYAAGTEFQLDKKRLGIFDKFVRESYLKVIRGQYCHFNVMGRGMSRANVTKKENSVQYCKSMAILMPERANEYNEAIARLSGTKPAGYYVKPGSTVYFNGDYALHIRPGYSFGVRSVSSRTLRNEYGNGENLQTYFVSDGSTHISVKGGEYYNIFPLWNWARIPGVTSPEMDTVPKSIADWQTPGTSAFTGGVSDSLYSVFTYMYEDNYAGINTAAKKSWFFFDEEIVCLGSGINSSAAFPVNTTVNQCLLQSDILVSEGGKEKKPANKKYSIGDKLDWILHGGIGYVFPEGGNINVSGMEQSGSWKKITMVGRDTVEKKNIFTLWIDHGMHPKQGTYAYVVVPDKHTAQEMNEYDAAGIKILSNSESVQVVQNKNLDMWQMVFFKPGSFSYGGTTVTVDAPCAIILNKMRSRPVMHIADPGHRQGKINVEVSGLSGKTNRIAYDFANTGVYAGKSKSFSIE
ncbi:MAG: polysaccharide lyase 8 family protein [Prevotella sp.]|jgi:chondroitin AC lyase|nr:polysaccharide lyase 8 family protein [Prevotella sp.]